MSQGTSGSTGDSFTCMNCGDVHDRLPGDGICRNCEMGTVLNVATASKQEMLDAVVRGPSKLKLIRRALVSFAIGLGGIILVVIALVVLEITQSEPDAQMAVRFRHDGPPGELDTQRPPLSAYTEAVGELGPGLADCFVVLQGSLQEGYGETLTVGWMIEVDGSVRNATVLFSSMPETVGGCALRKIEQWQFAPIAVGAPLQIEVPFVYLKHKNGFAVSHPRAHAVVSLSWPREPNPED